MVRAAILLSLATASCYGSNAPEPSPLTARFEEVSEVACDCLVDFTVDFDPANCPVPDPDGVAAACLAEWDSREDVESRRQVDCLMRALGGVESCLLERECGAPICRPSVSSNVRHPEVLAAIDECGEAFLEGPVTCLPHL